MFEPPCILKQTILILSILGFWPSLPVCPWKHKALLAKPAQFLQRVIRFRVIAELGELAVIIGFHQII